MTPTLERARAAVLALGILAASNVVANRVADARAYVPWNLAQAAALAWLARSAGVQPAHLGLDGRHLARGIRTGAAAAGVVTLAYGAGLMRRDTAALRDRRVTELSPGEVWFHALVRIPLGTAAAEEFAFRAVLPALLRTSWAPSWAPDALSSVLFGLWHILPSRELATANDGAGHLADRLGSAGVTAVAVAATTATGGVLAVVRHCGGHLIAPFALHWSSNALGMVAARLAGRRR